ncbi:hypothetical protein C0Q70_07457 [Pomacea canaliculata]|uniref:Secreted protein n=1 Tax=Pomacea canaliculata TaxID=400727 RepID=A0A2T7PF28_POMCA|nr:hypothetical protein C0Q70_07457 [Pomacea canaliculata]
MFFCVPAAMRKLKRKWGSLMSVVVFLHLLRSGSCTGQHTKFLNPKKNTRIRWWASRHTCKQTVIAPRTHAHTLTRARLPEARSTAVDAISSGMQAADEVARAVSRPAQDNSLIFILASRFSAGELQKTDKNSSKAADCGNLGSAIFFVCISSHRQGRPQRHLLQSAVRIDRAAD